MARKGQFMQKNRPGGKPVAQPLTGGIGGMPWRATDNPDEKEPDGDTARRIAKLITQHKDEPFFIACGFRKPHTPLFAPRKYFDMYSLSATFTCRTRRQTIATTSRRWR